MGSWTLPLLKPNFLSRPTVSNYSGNFDATVEYLMNQVTHQQVNQQLNIASVDSGPPSHLKTKDKRDNNIKMPLI